MKRRAKNLGDREIAAIVSILDGWTGRLSWESLINAITERNLGKYTRQALHRHERIHHAFIVCKERLATTTPVEAERETAPELRAALQRIARLEAENVRLKGENHRLLEQFACWAYNAHIHGLNNEQLSRPLPRVNRDTSDARTVKSSARKKKIRLMNTEGDVPNE